MPHAVVEHLLRGAQGRVPETPKAGDPRLRWAAYRAIGGRHDAMWAASDSAEALGYRVVIEDAPVIGEASRAALDVVNRLAGVAAASPGPACLITSGETTVRVRGGGKGGRNQELALAIVPELHHLRRRVALASIGTDGVDGPTDAAGAVADSTSAERAAHAGMEPREYLAVNDSYSFFARLGDLVRTGPTGTNVGDLQIAIVL
jgi:hydroxypyruvate reductase